MKKFSKNPRIVGTEIAAVGGVLLSFVLDWINDVDWLSTFKTVINFIVNTVITFLNFELKVWWLLITVAFVVIVLFTIAKLLDAKSKNDTIDFCVI